MTSMTPCLTIVKCYMAYVIIGIRCFFKSDSTVYINDSNSPITSADAHAGRIYSLALLKAYTRYKKLNNRFYIKFIMSHRKQQENELVRVSGKPIYYILHDVLQRSGFKVVRIEKYGTNPDHEYFLIEKE